MTAESPVAALPVAWLRPLPQGYVIPLWRWLILPATAFMLKRNGGVWVSGELKLMPSRLEFSQSRLIKSSRIPPMQWSIPLDGVSDVAVKKGITSETVEIRHPGETIKLMTARSADFLAKLDQAISASR